MKAVTSKDKRTKAELADEINRQTTAIFEMRGQRDTAIAREASATKERDATRSQFADLKEQLFAAQTNNAALLGYLDRVMEDDHAREELVPTGDPEGVVTMVPKRKHRPPMQALAGEGLAARRDFIPAGPQAYRYSGNRMDDECVTPRSKHWVNY